MPAARQSSGERILHRYSADWVSLSSHPASGMLNVTTYLLVYWSNTTLHHFPTLSDVVFTATDKRMKGLVNFLHKIKVFSTTLIQ